MKIFPSQLHRPLTTIRHPGLVVSLALLALTGAATTTQAQLPEKARAWPERPIRLIVPYPAGGGVDIVARAVSGSLGERLGQAVVVDNRPGAGSVIGVDLAAKAQADGHTLVFVNLAYAVNATLVPKLPYDATRDLYAVSLLGTQPHVLVAHPSVPAKNVREMIALAKARPGQLFYASSGHGTSPHLSMELFSLMAGIKMIQVPYKSSGPGVIDLLAGQVASMAPSMISGIPHVRSGKLRALGVTTAQRSPSAPEIPTIAESGLPGYESAQWYGLLAPAATSKDILEKLHREVTAVLRAPEHRELLGAEGGIVVAGTPEAFTAVIRAETAKWLRVAKDAGLVPE